jgi:glycerol-1-phosphate dehydrogenase [NAD(P)+]
MNQYLNKTITCNCGKKHQIPIKEIIIENDALKKVPDLINQLSNENKLYIICDQNTLAAAGKKLHNICQQNGFEVELIILRLKQIGLLNKWSDKLLTEF